jgi:hypothetical protein
MQAPANLPSSLSAPLQSMTAVAVVQTPRSKLQTASGEPDTAFAAANGTVSRSSPPKKRASRAEAQDRAEARAGHTPVQPKLDTVSRTARQTRDSPKQVEPCSPRSTSSPRTASAEPEAPACRYQRPKPRHQLAERHSSASTAFARRRTQSSEIQCGSSAVSSPRQRDRHIAVHRRSDVPHDPVRPVASSVTAVQAHPSRSTHHPKTAHRTSHPVKPFEHTRCPKSPHVSTAEAADTWRPSLDSLSQNPKAGRDLGNEILHPRERSEGRTERRTRHGSLPPEGNSAHVFEPTGRSQTTSPMGFVAFRRNQHR